MYNAFHLWKQSTKKALQNAEGPKWFGGGQPFTHNPHYKPLAPIKDAIKVKIYNQFKSGETARKLSSKYKISIERIDAICRMKKLLAAKVNGGDNGEYIRLMESTLGARGDEAKNIWVKHEKVNIKFEDLYSRPPQLVSVEEKE